MNGRLLTCLLTITVALLCASPAWAQKSRGVIGIHRTKPMLAPPAILSRLPEGIGFETFDLPLSRLVPMKISLVPGKRAGEYRIKSTPRIPVNKFIVPGLLNVTLKFGKLQRDHRWYVREFNGRLHAMSQSGTLLKIKRYEIFFLDMDSDGVFGGVQDAYVIKPPKQRQWAKPGMPIYFHLSHAPQTIRGVKVWMKPDPLGFRCLVTSKAPDYNAIRREQYKEALALINEKRAAYGFAPVTRDDKLSLACEEHSLYCSLHGPTHHQDPKKEGATRAGARAGLRSEVAPGTMTMKGGVVIWMHTFYHRMSMLMPGLTAVGMGQVCGVSTLDTGSRSRRKDFEPFCWPRNGESDVPIHWFTGENPSPLQKGVLESAAAARLGYPISITFPNSQVKSVKARLLEGDRELRIFVSSPEKPGNPDIPANKNAILVMSLSPLTRKTRYTVEVSCLFKGKPMKKIWSFRTR